jgi:hypothetical protein
MNRNVYEPLNLSDLRQFVRKLSKLYSPGSSSGFQVEDSDGEYATVHWQNVGDDGTLHRDESKKLAKRLNKKGYEVRVIQPAKTTLIVRKVKANVTHGSALPENVKMSFEAMVDSLCEAELKSIKDFLKHVALMKGNQAPQSASQAEEQGKNFYFNSQRARDEFKDHESFGAAASKAWAAKGKGAE